MHQITISTKFTFGDRVGFDSKQQGFKGTGIVDGITINSDQSVDYLILLDGEPATIQPGILEREMWLVETL